jgi:hypothetical protein
MATIINGLKLSCGILIPSGSWIGKSHYEFPTKSIVVSKIADIFNIIFKTNFMNAKILIVIVFHTFFLPSCYPKKLVCPPDNEPVVVQNPKKQYADYVKTTEVNVKGTINVLEQVKIGDLDASTKGSVTKLRQDLDQFSSRYQGVLKGSFLAYSTTPCDKDIRKKHYDLLAEMSKQNSALEQTKNEIGKLVSAGSFAGADEAKLRAIIAEYEKNKATTSIVGQ